MSNYVKSLCVLPLFIAGCSSPQLPSNVNSDGKYITSVKYTQPYAVDFEKVKRCIALTISNEDVRLKDSSGSFVGAYSKRYYDIGQTQIDFAPNTIVRVDEFHRHIVVNGNTAYVSRAIGNVVRFRLQVQSRPVTNETNMLFDNIVRAQLHTGSIANTGFSPVGTWFGAGTLDVTQAIDNVQRDLTQCFNQ